MSGHTPGPWELTIVRNRHWVCTDEADIAEVCDYGGDESRESDANARLIAAAPELLEAAQKSLGVLSGNDMNKSALIDALTLLRAAINKATSP